MTLRCTTQGCDHPGIVTGQFEDWGEQWNVNYCIKCASLLWADGSFIPDDADQLHRADQLSEREARELARMEAAPPAPESFDAVAAVRRVMALADLLEERVVRIRILLPDYDMGRNVGADDERVKIAKLIRAAIEGDGA